MCSTVKNELFRCDMELSVWVPMELVGHFSITFHSSIRCPLMLEFASHQWMNRLWLWPIQWLDASLTRSRTPTAVYRRVHDASLTKPRSFGIAPLEPVPHPGLQVLSSKQCLKLHDVSCQNRPKERERERTGYEEFQGKRMKRIEKAYTVHWSILWTHRLIKNILNMTQSAK